DASSGKAPACAVAYPYPYFSSASDGPGHSHLSLHDALPICVNGSVAFQVYLDGVKAYDSAKMTGATATKQISLNVTGKSQLRLRSEEHTSELQSPDHLVCRLLLEKKKKQRHQTTTCSLLQDR